jgi:2-polyprenyl-6-methoxyphenol hydroxylase-like FAD-dependent oxidoreductase
LSEPRYDAVIVGAGIGGGALGTALARAGRSVLLLERSLVHEDRVRGEWIAPWGVLEAKRLGLYDQIRAAGGHHVARQLTCVEGVDPAQAQAMPLHALVPDAPGPLTYGHPALCDLLDAAAVRAGATLLRGVEQVQVEAGPKPRVHYRHAGAPHTAACRLVVGADGRASSVRRQVGIALYEDPAHHLMSGLLVEDAAGWPEDLETTGTEGDVHFLAFPQGGGRVRLYLCYALEQRGRLAGPEGPRRFLEAFRLRCVPGSEHLAGARPAGPCPSYPNFDTWTDRPFAPGLVLVGDAAGYNDPITGQGLSITLRDVRIVRDLLLASSDWGGPIFEPYAEERADRMRRLRVGASLVSKLFAEFGPDARARRLRAFARLAENPLIGLPLAAAFLGPDLVPESALRDAERAIFAA